MFLIAEIDGEIIGNLTFRGGQRPRIAHVGEFGISILKKYWGLNIGEFMITYLLEWAKETKEVRKIDLRVRSDNGRAISLYKKMGFEEQGLFKRDFFLDGKFFDSISMGICIDPE